MSDVDQPDPADAPELPGEVAEPEAEDDILDQGHKEPSPLESYPDGLQYKDEELEYNEYNGYALPSDNEEPVTCVHTGHA
jgi:hypothetical protein